MSNRSTLLQRLEWLPRRAKLLRRRNVYFDLFCTLSDLVLVSFAVWKSVEINIWLWTSFY